jgi:peptidyl-prolyl cis-trans isomerase B (cyclophilin B)
MGIRSSLAASAALAVLLLALVQCVPAEPGLALPSGPLSPPPTDEAGVVYTETQNLTLTNRIAVIEVAGYGTIKFELYDNMTPITTQNFVDLAESGFYDGIKFHRCIDDFVAQTGDPNSKNNNPYDDGMGGSDTTIPLEINYNATHVDGAVGMARSSEPDSASSQFYICDGPQHGLDDEQRMENNGEHGYAVFGVVIEGLEIAKSIAGCDTWGYKRPLLKDHPIDDITMTKVTILPGVLKNTSINETSSDKDKEKSTPLGLEVAFFAIVAVVAVLYKRRY